MHGVVMLWMEPQEEDRICAAIQGLTEVRKAHMVRGEVDAMLLVEGESPQEIGRFVFDKIHTIRGIKDSTIEIIQESHFSR